MPTKENRTQENTALPLATTDTGDRLAPVARPCWLSLPRSMMMHRKGNEHSQAYSLTGSYHCRQRRTGTQGHRQARSPSVLSLQENTGTGEQEHRRIPTQGRPLTGGRPLAPLAPVTDIGANTYRPLATAHTLAPVVPVCFNLFRVMIPTPQRNTGDRGDRNSTHRLLPTGSLLYVCASSSGATSSGGQEHRRIPTGSLSRPCMLQSLSGCHLTLLFGEK